VLLSDLINASRESSIQDKDAHSPSFLAPYKDELLGAAGSGLKSKAARLPALTVIKSLVSTKSLMTDEEICYIVHLLDEVFCMEGDHDDLR
jgi:DNA repair/transcription protein MET18/MMS19